MRLPARWHMDAHETLLELAQRHVSEGEARVAHQAALVAKLAQQGCDTAQAESLLATMKDTLRLMHEHLAIEQEQARPRP